MIFFLFLVQVWRNGKEGEVTVSQAVGGEMFGSLGTSLAVTRLNIHGGLREVVVAGEPSSASGGLMQAGRVVILAMEEGRLVRLASFGGDSELGRMGMRVVAGSGGGVGMVVAAPYAGLYLDKFGKVYVVGEEGEEGAELPGGDITSHCPAAQTGGPCPDAWSREVLVGEVEANSLFGSDMSVADNGDRMLVAVGAGAVWAR